MTSDRQEGSQAPPAPAVPDLNRWSLVVAGAWNQAIFSDDWTLEHVFRGADKLESEVSLHADGSIARRFKGLDFRFTVFPLKVEFHPLANTHDALARIERAAAQLLERLQDTPLTAFGVNFGFDADSEALTRAVTLLDAPLLTAAGCEVQSTRVRRRIVYRGQVVNLQLSREGSLPVKIDFNHHFDARGSQNVRDQMNDSMVRSLEATRELLNLYGLELGVE